MGRILLAAGIAIPQVPQNLAIIPLGGVGKVYLQRGRPVGGRRGKVGLHRRLDDNGMSAAGAARGIGRGHHQAIGAGAAPRQAQRVGEGAQVGQGLARAQRRPAGDLPGIAEGQRGRRRAHRGGKGITGLQPAAVGPGEGHALGRLHLQDRELVAGLAAMAAARQLTGLQQVGAIYRRTPQQLPLAGAAGWCGRAQGGDRV